MSGPHETVDACTQQRFDREQIAHVLTALGYPGDAAHLPAGTHEIPRAGKKMYIKMGEQTGVLDLHEIQNNAALCASILAAANERPLAKVIPISPGAERRAKDYAHTTLGQRAHARTVLSHLSTIERTAFWQARS